jgi:NADH-quinone oxidoreductase subunit L
MPVIGLCTAAVTSYIAIYQHDVKRALAYSTSSQIGLLFLGSLLMGSVSYHLFTHAIFKSSLFLIVGAYLHSNHEQVRDNRIGQVIDNKLSKYLITVTALSLVALPASMGGQSKETIYT